MQKDQQYRKADEAVRVEAPLEEELNVGQRLRGALFAGRASIEKLSQRVASAASNAAEEAFSAAHEMERMAHLASVTMTRERMYFT